MADQPNAAATTPLTSTVVQPPGTTGPAQPAGFQVPEGQKLVPEAEWQRTQDRLRGQHDYVERGRKYGFDKPEAFEKYGKFTSTLKQKGLTLDQLMQAFDSDPTAGADAAEAQGFSPAQIDQYLQQKGYMTKDAFEKERSFDRAEFEYKTEAQKEEELRKHALAEFLGKDTPEDEREFWEALAFKELETRRVSPETMYPKEHPLAEKYVIRPFREQEIKSVFESLAKKRDLRKGAKLAALGGAAKPGVTATPAGSSATSPTSLPKSHNDDKRPGGKPSVAEAEAWHAKRKQQRGGGTVSSMGG